MTQGQNAKRNEKMIIRVDPNIEDIIPGFFENKRNDIKAIGEALKQVN
jgi:hypothetical protein